MVVALGIDPAAGCENLLHLLRIRGVHLVDDEEVRDPEVGLAGIVAELVSGAVGIDQGDVEVGFVEGGVVVAAIPEDDVGLFLGFAEDLLVVDPGINDKTVVDVGFVLLALLDRALVAVEILVVFESLAGLFGEIAVGHGVADRDDPLAEALEQPRDVAGGLRFADTGANRGDGDEGLGRLDHGPRRRADAEVGAPPDDFARLVHDIGVRHIGVREPHFVDIMFADDLLEIGFGEDRDAFGIERTRDLRRIDPVLDVGDLRRRESDDVILLVVPVETVEIVKIATGRAHDDDPGSVHGFSSLDTHADVLSKSVGDRRVKS